MKHVAPVRPLWLVNLNWVRPGLLALLLLLSLPAFAQRPQLRSWNVGAGIGVSPINAYTGWPILSGHLGRWSLDIAPYTFNQGMAVTHHFPVLTILKQVHFTLDGMAFCTRQNANVFLTFPGTRGMHNEISTGLMAGPTVYFLRRFSVQALWGAQYRTEYGPTELMYSSSPYHYIGETASLSLQVKLFQNFAQQ